jgi:hypothetical protein
MSISSVSAPVENLLTKNVLPRPLIDQWDEPAAPVIFISTPSYRGMSVERYCIIVKMLYRSSSCPKDVLLAALASLLALMRGGTASFERKPMRRFSFGPFTIFQEAIA